MAKQIRLIALRLRNFKGLREFGLDALGENLAVYGDNATGKTTLADAFMWLLFDKDSANRKDFGIKTLDRHGRELHNLEHEVLAVLDVDGQAIELRKVYKETWTKKRGSATAEFTGHTTDHYIDGVPVQLKEYKARVAEIADESTFRLLTDPRFFNEQLHWQKRREILLQVCGDVSDAEVIASTPALAALPEILRNRSLADHRKVIAARRSEINRELTSIPVRIDEATRSLSEASGDRAELTAELDRLNQQRQAKLAELARIDNGAEIVQKRRQVGEIDLQLMEVQKRVRSASLETIQQEQQRLNEATNRFNTASRDLTRLSDESRDAEQRIASLTRRLDQLRQEWAQISAREFTLSVEESCPACGQALPAERVEAARERALADFNSRRSADLETNAAEGKRVRGEIEALQAEQDRRAAQRGELEAQLERWRAEVSRIQQRIAQLQAEVPDHTQDAEYRRLAEAKRALEQEIEALRTDGEAARQRVAGEVAQIDQEIRRVQAELVRIDQRAAGLQRIAELEAQEKALAAEYERLETELYLTEEFIRAKVRLLEDRINSRFQHARFKLFNVQVNGGLEECCETTYQGVPYSDLNTGARTNVGLDIINTLSEHYGFEAPIWIDNREAVTRLIPTRAQVISLIVSEPDKRLRVERDTAPALQKEAV
ncbi:MAG: hypothetical protein ACOY93_08630 [Bacillota bacterium]